MFCISQKLCYNARGDNMKDYLVKAYAFDGTVRIYAARTKNLAEQARKIHDLWPTSAAAMGRLLTASVIMGAMYKDDQEITIRIESDGPIEGMVTTANAHGEVRGYLGNPHVFMQYNTGKLDVGSAVGNGFIHVTKDVKIRDIFTSTAKIQTGEIGEDFAYYFTASEQIPSAVGLGVKIDEDNTVIHSGGFILQRMPGCSEETVELIEKRLNDLPPITDLLASNTTPEKIIELIAKDDHKLLHTLDLNYHCPCNKEKFERGLISLGKQELTTLLKEDKQINTVCHFCKTEYHFDEAAIKALIKESK